RSRETERTFSCQIRSTNGRPIGRPFFFELPSQLAATSHLTLEGASAKSHGSRRRGTVSLLTSSQPGNRLSLKREAISRRASHVSPERGGTRHMREYRSADIRNVAVVGHGASGKTTLVDALAFVSGASKRHGSVKDGTTLTDYSPEEIERGYSINLG